MTTAAHTQASKALRGICLALASMLLALYPLTTRAALAKDAAGKPVVVSMGDSYSSGEGTEPFYGQSSSNKHENEDWLAHRSEQAWPGKLQIGGATMADGKDDNWFFVAASGSLIKHVTTEKQTLTWKERSSSGSHQLPVQIDVFTTKGIKDNVDYITITLGGNDYGFRDIMTAAATDLPLIGSGDLQSRINQAKADLDSTILPALKETYQSLLNVTSDQTVLIVVGYPRLLASNMSANLLFDQNEASIINSAIDTFDTKVADLVASMNSSRIVYVDPRSAFSGHEAYASNSYINSVTLGAQDQDLNQTLGALEASQYSLHPNAKGQTAYASVVQAAIDELEAAHVPAHTHSYGEPSYEWAAQGDSWTCTATMTCKGCAAGTEGHTVSEAAAVTYAVTKAPACADEGVGTYTATFSNSAFATQTKEVALATASHSLTKVDAVAATCSEAGTKEHWECSACHKLFADAQGTSEATEASLVIPIDANAHSWGDEPSWAWADDHSATATFACERNAGHTQIIPAELATEDVEGGTRFIATVVGPDGKTYTDSVMVPNEPPATQGEWVRVKGSGRYQTMAAIVDKGFETSDWAVVATGDNFPDALVASSLAGSRDYPVILTAKAELSPEAEAKLVSLKVKSVYIMGGTGAVSQDVEDAIEGLGIEATRVKGAGRQATSLAAMEKISGYDTVVVATGGSFADALSIGPWCFAKGAPILLTDQGALSDDQLAAIEAAKPSRVVIVGGTGAVPQDVEDAIAEMGIEVTRLKGSGRYETSRAIAEFETSAAEGMGFAHAAVATGAKFPDALAGATLCGHNGSVLVLAADTNPEGDGVALEYVKGKNSEVEQGYVLGGSGVVSDDILDYLNK